MRCLLLSVSLLALVLGTGCRHVAGRHDCYTSNDTLDLTGAGVAGTSYHATGQPIPGTSVPEKLNMPATEPNR